MMRMCIHHEIDYESDYQKIKIGSLRNNFQKRLL